MPFFESREKEHEPYSAERLAEKMYATDIAAKRLTGRTPERISQETGISPERIFPKDATILYVGDPWQRMGREIDEKRLHIIDYEFGESAEFISDNEWFRADVRNSGEYLLQDIAYGEENDTVSQADKIRFTQFKTLIAEANASSVAAEFPQDTDKRELWDSYFHAADAWEKARVFLEQWHQETDRPDPKQRSDPGDEEAEGDTLSGLRKRSWYMCMENERGFRDIPDWYTIIAPKILAKQQDLEKFDNTRDSASIQEELKRAIIKWIHEIRTQKKTEYAHVIQGIFPELPFRKESFDRFVASWSISAHAFEEMSEDEFEECWHEIERVLKPGGEAFIFPIRSYTMDSIACTDPLFRMPALDWRFYDTEGKETENIDECYTLWLQKETAEL